MNMKKRHVIEIDENNKVVSVTTQYYKPRFLLKDKVIRKREAMVCDLEIHEIPSLIIGNEELFNETWRDK